MTGNMVITIDDMEYNASAGDILICFPNLVHATHTPVSSTALFFIFDVGFVNDYSNELLKMHPAAPLIKKDCVEFVCEIVLFSPIPIFICCFI